MQENWGRMPPRDDDDWTPPPHYSSAWHEKKKEERSGISNGAVLAIYIGLVALMIAASVYFGS